MTADFAELAALWSAPPAPSERDELARLARRTPLRMRALQATELAIGGVVAAGILAAMLWRLGLASLLTGALVLALLGWSTWQRHRLIDVALLVDRSDRLTFLRSLVRGKEAELQRSAVGLGVVIPSTVLALVLGYFVQHDPAQMSFSRFLTEVVLTPRGFAAFALLGGAMLALTLSHLRVVRELGRLRLLRDDYAAERRLDLVDETDLENMVNGSSSRGW